MKPTAPNRSYTGESVYVGIDVHKRTYSVVARIKHKEEKRWTTSAEPEKLGEQLCKVNFGSPWDSRRIVALDT
jgi:hypothetical protein